MSKRTKELFVVWSMCLLALLVTLGAVSGGTGYNAVTNALHLTGSTSTYLRSDGNQAAPAGGGGSFVGAVSNNVASAGLLAVDNTKTNGIAATPAHVTTALGFTPANVASPTFTGTATIPTSSVTTANIGSGFVTNNIGAILDVGNTTYVDMTKASRTNAVSSTLTLLYATNGVDLVDYTHVRWLFNGSGSDQTLSIPTGWRTNVYSAVPPKLTNATITKMVLSCNGPTGSAVLQTNCYVSFEYFK